jgi:hypothetical protein
MNWYRKSQSSDDPPEWEYPGNEQHDYNPYWDYEHDSSVDQRIKAFVEAYISELRSKLFPRIGFLEDMRVAFVKLPDNAVAMYINGTEPYVVIAVDIQKTVREVGKLNDASFLESHIKVSIVHELAHAIQEGMDLEFDEGEAEGFARAYVDFGDVEAFWEGGLNQ